MSHTSLHTGGDSNMEIQQQNRLILGTQKKGARFSVSAAGVLGFKVSAGIYQGQLAVHQANPNSGTLVRRALWKRNKLAHPGRPNNPCDRHPTLLEMPI